MFSWSKTQLFVDFEHIKLLIFIFGGLLCFWWHITAIWANQSVSERFTQQLRDFLKTKCMWERVCGCESVCARTYVFSCVCRRVWMCVCVGGRGCWVCVDISSKSKKIWWKSMIIYGRSPRCSQNYKQYLLLSAVVRQFSADVFLFSTGARSVFFWCSCSFLLVCVQFSPSTHTNNKHIHAQNQMHKLAHTRTHARTQ